MHLDKSKQLILGYKCMHKQWLHLSFIMWPQVRKVKRLSEGDFQQRLLRISKGCKPERKQMHAFNANVD